MAQTLRREFLGGRTFASLADAQTQLDGWVHHYNHERPHQSLGGAPPWERFRLAAAPAPPTAEAREVATEPSSEPVTTRRVSRQGTISFATATYKVGAWLAGQTVEVVCDGGLVQLHHRGVLVATHARRHPSTSRPPSWNVAANPRPSRPAATAASVTRKGNT